MGALISKLGRGLMKKGLCSASSMGPASFSAVGATRKGFSSASSMGSQVLDVRRCHGLSRRPDLEPKVSPDLQPVCIWTHRIIVSSAPLLLFLCPLLGLFDRAISTQLCLSVFGFLLELVDSGEGTKTLRFT
jgi:hypothetical protein